MQFIATRTTPKQMESLLNIVTDEQGCLLHEVSHNLDGLWLNLRFSNVDGDWIASIDRDGNVEATQ